MRFMVYNNVYVMNVTREMHAWGRAWTHKEISIAVPLMQSCIFNVLVSYLSMSDGIVEYYGRTMDYIVHIQHTSPTL